MRKISDRTVAKEYMKGLKLKAENLFYSTALKNSEEGICFLTPNLTVLFWNDAAADILGVPAERIVGRSLINLRVGEDPEEWENTLVNIAEKGKSFGFHITVKDEEYEKKVAVDFHAIKDASGKNTGFVAFFRDLSKLLGRGSVETLEGIKDICEVFFSDIPDLVFVVDGEKRVVWMNQASLNFLKDVVKGSDFGCFPDFLGECPLQSTCCIYSYSPEKKPPVCEVETTAHGRHLSVLCLPVLARDRLVCSLHFVRDVTETKNALEKLKSSEESYRSVIENGRGFYIHRFDRNGNLLLASPYMEKIFGGSLDEYLGDSRGWMGQIHPRDIERIASEISYSLENAVTFDQQYRIIPRDDKDVVWVRTRFYPIFDKSGEVRYFDGITFDITEQKQMEKQIISSERMKAIGEMTGGVAHNINNLLAGIMGNLQLLEMEGSKYLPPTALNQIQQAFLGSRRIGELVKQMLTFARAEDSDDTWINVSVLAIVNRVIKLTEPLWKDAKQKEGKEVRFRVDIPEDIQVVGNINELTTLFNNIIVNSIEAIDDIGSISITGKMKSDKLVEITVSDTGKGMSPETLKRSIEPLFSTKGTVGVGMGLSVAYGIAKKYQGDISITSETGKGTSVTIILPSGYKEEILELKEEQKIMVSDTGIIRVLVIEDEPDVREILALFLEKRGYEVEVASSGHEGVKMFMEKPFDVVFTDLGMARMTGWEVAQKIKSERQETRIFLLTGWGSEIEKEDQKMKYIDGVVYKPFDLEKLSNLLAKISGN